MIKQRLDIYIKEKLGISRSEAAALISEGFVKNGEKIIKKPSYLTDGAEIIIDTAGLKPYVSRGGLKLKKAIDCFNIKLDGKVCLDIGASTGGFTDCMLKEGAAHVYAVDVGRSQLAKSLLNDERVLSFESTNILEIDSFSRPVDFVSIDVSFVSVVKILKKAYELMAEDAEGVFLIKPQFEAGREYLSKRGICKDPKIHKRVLNNVIIKVVSVGFNIKGLTYSPIKGGDGNIEYLLYVSKTEKDQNIDNTTIDTTVKNAFISLKEN